MINRYAEARRERRAPMGARTDEEHRAVRGRTPSSRTVVHVRDISPSQKLDREWLRQRLGFKLGKFAIRIDRVDVVLRNESGPTGRPVIRSTIRLRVANREPVAVSARGVSGQVATSAALQSCERTLRRMLEREVSLRTAARGRAVHRLLTIPGRSRGRTRGG